MPAGSDWDRVDSPCLGVILVGHGEWCSVRCGRTGGGQATEGSAEVMWKRGEVGMESGCRDRRLGRIEDGRGSRCCRTVLILWAVTRRSRGRGRGRSERVRESQERAQAQAQALRGHTRPQARSLDLTTLIHMARARVRGRSLRPCGGAGGGREPDGGRLAWRPYRLFSRAPGPNHATRLARFRHPAITTRPGAGAIISPAPASHSPHLACTCVVTRQPSRRPRARASATGPQSERPPLRSSPFFSASRRPWSALSYDTAATPARLGL